MSEELDNIPDDAPRTKRKVKPFGSGTSGHITVPQSVAQVGDEVLIVNISEIQGKSNKQIKAYVYERGNGLPSEGEMIADDKGVYKVAEYTSQIDTRSGRGNRKKAILECVGDPFDVSEEKYESLRPVLIEEKEKNIR